MSRFTDELDVALTAKVDVLILKFRRCQEKYGELTNNQVMCTLSHMFDIHGPDHPAGPMLCLATELLLRHVNATPSQLPPLDEP